MAKLAGIFDDVFNPTKQDLEAIHTYVIGLKSKNPPPAASTLIGLFEKWYNSLGVTDWFADLDTLKEAQRRRNAIDEAMGQKRDYSTSAASFTTDPFTPSYSGPPAGGNLVTSLRHASGTEAEGDPEPGPNLGLGLKIGAGVLVAALATLLILSRRL